MYIGSTTQLALSRILNVIFIHPASQCSVISRYTSSSHSLAAIVPTHPRTTLTLSSKQQQVPRPLTRRLPVPQPREYVPKIGRPTQVQEETSLFQRQVQNHLRRVHKANDLDVVLQATADPSTPDPQATRTTARREYVPKIGHPTPVQEDWVEAIQRVSSQEDLDHIVERLTAAVQEAVYQPWLKSSKKPRYSGKISPKSLQASRLQRMFKHNKRGTFREITEERGPRCNIDPEKIIDNYAPPLTQLADGPVDQEEVAEDSDDWPNVIREPFTAKEVWLRLARQRQNSLPPLEEVRSLLPRLSRFVHTLRLPDAGAFPMEVLPNNPHSQRRRCG